MGKMSSVVNSEIGLNHICRVDMTSSSQNLWTQLTNTSKQEVHFLSTTGNHRCSVIVFNLDLYKMERWESLSCHGLIYVRFYDKDCGQ